MNTFKEIAFFSLWVLLVICCVFWMSAEPPEAVGISADETSAPQKTPLLKGGIWFAHYEYKIVGFACGTSCNDANERLTKLAAEGWRVVGVSDWIARGQFLCVLERVKQGDR